MIIRNISYMEKGYFEAQEVSQQTKYAEILWKRL